MELLNKNRLPFFLISGSLLLLLLFQGVWLNNSYEQEEENLREQADQVFIDAIREIEDSILRIAIFNVNDLMCNDTTSFSEMQVAFDINSDYVNKVIKWGQSDSLKIKKDTKVKIDIRTDASTFRKEKSFGSMSFFMATTDSSDHFSHPFLEGCEQNSLTQELLESELKDMMPLADVPQDYQLAMLKDDVKKEAGFYSTTQTDILRGGSYAIFFPNHRLFLLKKILPQLLFSLLLFSVIVLSFYMIWQSLEKQRRLTELKNDFISNVTHELKTPITTVGVAIEALSNFNAMQNPERTKEYLEISKYELNRLTILVDKVLKMSLFEKKEPELKIETFDLESLVNEILGSMKLQFEKFSAAVNFEVRGSSFLLQGDRIHLTSVIYNLIDNALKYSPEAPKIDLVLEEENNQIKFSVKDRGIGIPDVFLDKIFDKFFRVPSGDQHDIKGHGLGLSYVAGVINKHKGKIAVDSKKNIGTLFTIFLPKVYE
jgi:two-component system, OmpR family, phosphate regulon sensor histidine kinase PhoR